MEAEDYNLEEKELNNNWEAIGSRMTDFGHIGPDKEDLRDEYKCRHGGTEHHWVRVRDHYRNYDRPPFLKPETTQLEFYSEGLKGPAIAISSARKLWYLAVSIRFQDGVIPGFILDPADYVLMAFNQARDAVRGTIEVFSYGRN